MVDAKSAVEARIAKELDEALAEPDQGPFRADSTFQSALRLIELFNLYAPQMVKVLPAAIGEVQSERSAGGETLARQEAVRQMALLLGGTEGARSARRGERSTRARMKEADPQLLRLLTRLEALQNRVVSIVAELNRHEQLRWLYRSGTMPRDSYRRFSDLCEAIVRGLSYLSARFLDQEAGLEEQAVPPVLLRKGRRYFLDLETNLKRWEELRGDIEARITSPEAIHAIGILTPEQIEPTIEAIAYLEASRVIPRRCADLSTDVMRFVDDATTYKPA